VLCKALLQRLNFQTHRNQIILSGTPGRHVADARLLKVSYVVFRSVQALFDLCKATFQPEYVLLCGLSVISPGGQRNLKDRQQSETYDEYHQHRPPFQTAHVFHGSPLKDQSEEKTSTTAVALSTAVLKIEPREQRRIQL
jgi:hypothetical protein